MYRIKFISGVEQARKAVQVLNSPVLALGGVGDCSDSLLLVRENIFSFVMALELLISNIRF